MYILDIEGILDHESCLPFLSEVLFSAILNLTIGVCFCCRKFMSCRLFVFQINIIIYEIL